MEHITHCTYILYILVGMIHVCTHALDIQSKLFYVKQVVLLNQASIMQHHFNGGMIYMCAYIHKSCGCIGQAHVEKITSL